MRFRCEILHTFTVLVLQLSLGFQHPVVAYVSQYLYITTYLLYVFFSNFANWHILTLSITGSHVVYGRVVAARNTTERLCVDILAGCANRSQRSQPAVRNKAPEGSTLRSAGARISCINSLTDRRRSMHSVRQHVYFQPRLLDETTTPCRPRRTVVPLSAVV